MRVIQLWTKKWLPGIFFINLRSGVSGCFRATVSRETDKIVMLSLKLTWMLTYLVDVWGLDALLHRQDSSTAKHAAISRCPK